MADPAWSDDFDASVAVSDPAPPDRASVPPEHPWLIRKMTPLMLGHVAEFLDDKSLRSLAGSRKEKVRNRLLSLGALGLRLARLAAEWENPTLLYEAASHAVGGSRAKLWTGLTPLWERACQQGKISLMQVFLSTELFLDNITDINALARNVAFPRARRTNDPGLTYFLLKRNWIPNAVAPDAELLCFRAGLITHMTTAGSGNNESGLTSGETAFLLSKSGCGEGGALIDASFGGSFGRTVDGSYARAKKETETESGLLGVAGYVPAGYRRHFPWHSREYTEDESAMRAFSANVAAIDAFNPDDQFC
jgi:hypothetical protein